MGQAGQGPCCLFSPGLELCNCNSPVPGQFRLPRSPYATTCHNQFLQAASGHLRCWLCPSGTSETTSSGLASFGPEPSIATSWCTAQLLQVSCKSYGSYAPHGGTGIRNPVMEETLKTQGVEPWNRKGMWPVGAVSIEPKPHKRRPGAS